VQIVSSLVVVDFSCSYHRRVFQLHRNQCLLQHGMLEVFDGIVVVEYVGDVDDNDDDFGK